jgi:hypothetical protein
MKLFQPHGLKDKGEYVLGRSSCLGGVMVSVPVTRPKVRGFKSGRDDGLLTTIKLRSATSIGEELHQEHHVVRFYGM